MPAVQIPQIQAPVYPTTPGLTGWGCGAWGKSYTYYVMHGDTYAGTNLGCSHLTQSDCSAYAAQRYGSGYYCGRDITSGPPPSQPVDFSNPSSSPSKGKGIIGVTLLQTGNDIVIHLVIPQGPAAQAELKQGDIVRAIDGQKIASIQDFDLITSAYAPRTVVTYSIVRNGAPQDVQITIGARG